ncbi:MAG: chloride channel protein [Actinomycetota bacterium]|nr:chloride channel protein [Actinomycetota bacterium]
MARRVRSVIGAGRAYRIAGSARVAADARPRPGRQRIPRPLINRRLPSGRGAMEQPNATHDGAAALTPTFWLAVAVTGIATGLLGDAMMAILFFFEHAAFGFQHGSFESGVKHASPLRRVLVLVIAGAFGGIAWYLLRRYTNGKKAEVDDALWTGTGHLSFRRSLGTSVISEIVIGMGASLGREAAPKLLGGASGSALAGWLRLTTAQRRLLVACGAGAGLGAVYNVPLGGALFTVEILIGSITLPNVLPALACSGIATVTAWIYLPNQATYSDIPSYHSHARLIVWVLVAGPIIGLLAAAYLRLIGAISHHKGTGLATLIAPLVAFTVLGLIAIAYPQLLGNGKEIAHDVFLGHATIGLVVALAILKPLVTALCLGSGAAGGLLTPVLSSGAVLGAALGIAWAQVWPGSPVGAYALIGAAAAIGAAMQAPLTALVLVLEFTHTGFDLMIPMLLATVTATTITRYIDGYSIYSARLPAHSVSADTAHPAPTHPSIALDVQGMFEIPPGYRHNRFTTGSSIPPDPRAPIPLAPRG